KGITGGAGLELFGFTLVPTALPGILGLQLLLPSPTAFGLQASILAALVGLLALFVAAMVRAIRGFAAPVALVVYAAFGLFAALNLSAFAVFKICMYVQPFIAAAVGVWIVELF